MYTAEFGNGALVRIPKEKAFPSAFLTKCVVPFSI